MKSFTIKSMLVVGSIFLATVIVNAMTNPATTKCIEDGGKSSIVSDSSGNQSGICTFSNGFVCDEWAYFNGQCIKPQEQTGTIVGNDKDVHGCITSAGYTRSESLQQCIRPWEQTGTIVGNDTDSHGCIASAGYSWSQSKNECVRVWEYQETDLETAYDFAYNKGITTIKSLKEFRANDAITRQEASKMFVVFAEKVLGKVRDKGFSSECNETLDSTSHQEDIDPSLVDYLLDACKAGILKGAPISHTNGAKDFLPFNNITRAQAGVILMRGVSGMQDESTNPWWLKYWEKGYEKGYFTNTIAKNEEYESHAYIMLKPIYINKSSIDQSITRGELVERIYKFMLKKALHDHNN